jgi:uncharacterized protein YutE (UPF0331/DUF86 family)
MVLRREAIEERLKELDQILLELGKYRDTSSERFRTDVSQRWVVERGLIAAASVIFDVTDHILAGYFGVYADTYEESLRSLRDHKVLSSRLYGQIRGLGGFRNILVHQYLEIDPREVSANLHKALEVLPRWSQEILAWLDEVEGGTG